MEQINCPISVITYFGGKRKVSDIVWARFGDVYSYVEPFAGSLAVLLGRPTEPRIESVNDKDCYLANFWRALKLDPEGVVKYAQWPVNECVPEGTLISTPHGDIPIENIYSGMVIWGEQNNQIIPTTVMATTQNQSSEFYVVGSLYITGNHPVWTEESGYQAASSLTSENTIQVFNNLTNKSYPRLLSDIHETISLGNIHTYRSSNKYNKICWGNFTQQEKINRTFVKSNKTEDNPLRFMDPFPTVIRITSNLSNHRLWTRRRMEKCRKILDLILSSNHRFSKSYGWRRRNSRIYSYFRNSAKNFNRKKGYSISSQSNIRNVRKTSFLSSYRKNTCCQHWTPTTIPCSFSHFYCSQRETIIPTTQSKAITCTSKQNTYRRTQKEYTQILKKLQTSSLCRNRSNIPLNYRNITISKSNNKFCLSSNTKRIPLQRISFSIPIKVYNLQTTTSNYFANKILVHNCDLTARHHWLVEQKDFRNRMLLDPDFYDSKIAGWWVWGISAWIGGGWCKYSDDKDPHNKSLFDSEGNPRTTRPNLFRYGTGIHRQRPHLSGHGQGVNRLINQDNLLEYFNALASRLRQVRVCCGDWTRPTQHAANVSKHISPTGIFLDPPYPQDERDPGCYTVDSKEISYEVYKWAIENGENPNLRIALCGYDQTFDIPNNWETVHWTTHPGYSLMGNTENQNRFRECVWFSPYCINVKQLNIFE